MDKNIHTKAEFGPAFGEINGDLYTDIAMMLPDGNLVALSGLEGQSYG